MKHPGGNHASMPTAASIFRNSVFLLESHFEPHQNPASHRRLRQIASFIRPEMRTFTLPSCLRLAIISLALFLGGSAGSFAQTPPAGPKGSVILIIRHAEKPASGASLSDEGTKRANAYPGFFQNLKLDGEPATPTCLFATRDSENSQRPRLTIQPLSAALHLPLEADVKNKDFEVLVNKLKGAKYSGQTVLICWHHGQIPNLLLAFGANPAQLLPEGKWPENVFGWLVELRYDQEGRLKQSAVINENLEPSDAATPPPAAR